MKFSCVALTAVVWVRAPDEVSIPGANPHHQLHIYTYTHASLKFGGLAGKPLVNLLREGLFLGSCH